MHDGTVTINTSSLLQVLGQNLAEHRMDFDEAVAGYRKAIVAELERLLGAAREGVRIKHYIALQEPESHVRDYERVIKMLEMSTQPETRLTVDQFTTYVMDEWDWKGEFSAVSQAYGVKR